MRCVPAFMLVAWVACAPRVVWVGSDPYRRIQAEVRSQGGAQWMRLGGQDQEHYQAIGAAGIVFSNDGTRVAYPAERAGRWWMVVDGQPQGPWDGVADPAFSRDGKHLAFLAEQAGQWRAVVDGVIGPPSPAVQRGTLRFSVNAEHWGYVALPKDGCAAIAIDGVVGPCHTAVVSMRVTNLGAAAATVRDGARFHFLFGEQMGPAVDGIGAWAISEDGRRFAYAALEGKRWHAVVDGVSGAPADGVRDFQFGDEGARLAFVATDPGRARVVVDGAEGPPFLLVGKPLLAAHGPRVAYSAQDAQGAWVVVDEDRQGPFAAVLDVVLSGDGRHVAFLARRDGRVRVVHDGVETPLAVALDHSLVLSADGEHWAVVSGDAAAQQLWVSIDGKRKVAASSDDVFGDAQSLRPWVDRTLAAALASPEVP